MSKKLERRCLPGRCTMCDERVEVSYGEGEWERHFDYEEVAEMVGMSQIVVFWWCAILTQRVVKGQTCAVDDDTFERYGGQYE